MWLLLSALVQAQDFVTWAMDRKVVAHPEPDYHFAAEIYQDLAPLVEERPGVVSAEVIGRSVEKRPIWAFTVRDPATTPTHKVLVFAQIHALEWVPAEIARAFLLEIIQYPRRDVEVTVVPILNPDGRARVEADLLEGRNLYRRGNANKVDLNRDFAVNREPEALWEGMLPDYYASSPAPLSQPESQAIDRLAAREDYDVAVSLHSFGGFIYYPWSGRFERPPDWERYVALGKRMSQAMGPHAYRPRQLSRWGFFFRAQGSELDHLYGRYGTLTFLVETTRSGISPFRPSDWKTYFRWYNPPDPSRHAREGVRLLRAMVDAVDEGDF